MARHCVSNETYQKMRAAGWSKRQDETDAQELADELPPRIQLRSVDQNIKWLAGDMEGFHVAGPSMSEALAALYLKLKETNTHEQ